MFQITSTLILPSAAWIRVHYSERRKKNKKKRKKFVPPPPPVMTKQQDSGCSKPRFLIVPHFSLILTGVRQKMLLVPQWKFWSDIRCYSVNDYTLSVLYFSHRSTWKALGSRCGPRWWQYAPLHGWQVQRSRVHPKRMDEVPPNLRAIHTSLPLPKAKRPRFVLSGGKKQSIFLKTIPWATLYPTNTDACKWQSDEIVNSFSRTSS